MEQSVKLELNKKGNRRGTNPNSLKNLTRKGCGRPRNEASLTNIMRQKLDEVCPYDAQQRTWGEYLAERCMAQALENATYFNIVIERLEGKVLQPIGGENGEPIKYELTVKDTETKDLTERIIKGGSVVSNISLS